MSNKDENVIISLGSDWEDPDDPTVIAENELLGAASSIDAAAKKLANLRPRMDSTKVSYWFASLTNEKKKYKEIEEERNKKKLPFEFNKRF